eukprot:jgi/Mesvir1/12021/Mv00318-RA.1
MATHVACSLQAPLLNRVPTERTAVKNVARCDRSCSYASSAQRSRETLSRSGPCYVSQASLSLSQLSSSNPRLKSLFFSFSQDGVTPARVARAQPGSHRGVVAMAEKNPSDNLSVFDKGIENMAEDSEDDTLEEMEMLELLDNGDGVLRHWVDDAAETADVVEGRIKDETHFDDPDEMLAELEMLEMLNSDERKVEIVWTGEARDVKVAGAFNEWIPEPLMKSEDGWIGRFSLPMGKYPFKFVVDGKPGVDSKLPTVRDNAGGLCNVVAVTKDNEISNAGVD